MRWQPRTLRPGPSRRPPRYYRSVAADYRRGLHAFPRRRLRGFRSRPTSGWTSPAREIARMTASDVEFLKIYVLLSPALLFLVALGVVWLRRWEDEREDRRRAAKDAAAHRP